MLTSRFTTTARAARRRAPVERLMVTIAGSNCGVSPTAMASAKSTEFSSEWPIAMFKMRIEPARTAVTLTSRREKLRRPSWNAVCGWRSPSRSAMAPNSVAAPVATTTPRPLPLRTIVPMKAHEGGRPGTPA